jgi:hypothetical protein
MEPSQSRFLAVGHKGLRLFSADGTAWQDAQTGKEGEVFRAAAFGNGRAVAVGTYGGVNIFASSRDGKKWDASTRDGKYALFVRSLGFGKDFFLAIGGDPGAVGSSRPFETHSADGISWSDLREFGGKNILRRLAYGNERFVGVGDRGRRAASPDGAVWKDAPDVKAIDTLVDVTYGNGVFVGVGLHSLRMASADGLTWTDRQVGEEGEHLNSVVWAKDRFVAVGQGATYTSADGKTWQRAANKDAPLTVAFGNGIFVGANWKGRLLRSDDGVAWREVHKCEQHVEAVCFGNLA